MSRPRIFGLVRASTARQDQSVDLQVDRIATAAATIDGDYQRCFSDEKTSATKVPFFQRDGVKELLTRVQRGDYIIVWKLDRVARKMRDICDLVDWVLKNDLKLRVLDFGGEPLDLSTLSGKVVAYAFTMAAEIEAEMIRNRTREHYEYRRAKGLPYNGRLPIGHRKLTVRCHRKKRKWGNKRIIGYAEDEGYVRICGEIYDRRRKGESWYGILKDLLERGVTTPDGKPFGSITKTRKSHGADVRQLKACYAWYEEWIKQQGNHNGLPPNPPRL